MSVPDDSQRKALLLNPQTYDDVMAAAKANGAQYGRQLQWLSPHTIAWRGVPIFKQQE